MRSYPVFLERFFLQSPNINVALKLTIREVLSRDTVEQALSALMGRHPLLSSVVQLMPDNRAYLVEKPFAPADLMDFLTGWEPDWMYWYHIADERLYNFREGPLFRLGVFDGPGEGTTDVVFMGHHLIGDGMAFVNIAGSFIDALKGSLPAGPSIPPVLGINGSVRGNPAPGLMIRYLTGRLNRSWAKTGRIVAEEEFDAFRRQYREANPSGCVIHEIDREVLPAMLRKSREAGVSVNELISCALVRAVQMNMIACTDPPELGIAISVRNEVTPDASGCTGNFVSGVLVRKGYNNSKSLEENLQAFRKALRKKIHHRRKRYGPVLLNGRLAPGLLDSIYPAEYGSYGNTTSKKLARIMGERRDDKNIGISNLGKISWETAGESLVERIVFIPPAYPANALNLGIVTYNGTMNISIRYNQRLLASETVEKVYSDFITISV